MDQREELLRQQQPEEALRQLQLEELLRKQQLEKSSRQQEIEEFLDLHKEPENGQEESLRQYLNKENNEIPRSVL